MLCGAAFRQPHRARAVTGPEGDRPGPRLCPGGRRPQAGPSQQRAERLEPSFDVRHGHHITATPQLPTRRASCLWTHADRGPGPRGQGRRAQQPAPPGRREAVSCPGDSWAQRCVGPAALAPMCELRHSVTHLTLQPCGLYSPWDSPGQNTGVGSLSLLQGIFPTQGLNPSLLHCRQILYCLTHQGSPRPSLTKPAFSMSIRSQQSAH